jgi:hypothetical protein
MWSGGANDGNDEMPRPPGAIEGYPSDGGGGGRKICPGGCPSDNEQCAREYLRDRNWWGTLNVGRFFVHSLAAGKGVSSAPVDVRRRIPVTPCARPSG